MAVALTIIRDEHRALASVLKGLQYLLDPVHSGRQKPDFALMKAILAYIEHFPDRLHHPKEDQYLFPVLRERDPSVCVVLDELERQHHSGPDVIARVAQAMRDCEANASQLASLKQAVDDYADFQWSHMRKEEQILFPMLQRGEGALARMPIRVMRSEHDHHGEALRHLADLTDNLTLPPDACNTWRALYLGLRTLHEDLMEHIHLENNVLFENAVRGVN